MMRYYHITPDALPQLNRSLGVTLRVLRHWRVLAIVLALFLTGAPGVDLLRAEEAEPLESSEPVEESVASPHLHACRRCPLVREAYSRPFVPLSINLYLPPEVSIFQVRRKQSSTGHRLANDLCAPLLC
jgi:hypothetical protein